MDILLLRFLMPHEEKSRGLFLLLSWANMGFFPLSGYTKKEKSQEMSPCRDF